MSGRVPDLPVPAGWRPMTAAELAGRGGEAVAGCVRDDAAARLTVLRDRALPGDLHAVAATLRRRLRDEIADFRHVAERLVELPGGRAMHTSYARVETGAAESITVAPAAGCTYVLVATVAAGADAAAEEVAGLIGRFDVRTGA